MADPTYKFHESQQEELGVNDYSKLQSSILHRIELIAAATTATRLETNATVCAIFEETFDNEFSCINSFRSDDEITLESFLTYLRFKYEAEDDPLYLMESLLLSVVYGDSIPDFVREYACRALAGALKVSTTSSSQGKQLLSEFLQSFGFASPKKLIQIQKDQVEIKSSVEVHRMKHFGTSYADREYSKKTGLGSPSSIRKKYARARQKGKNEKDILRRLREIGKK